MPRARKYWLVKTEPESYSIHDLSKAPNQTTFWDGVRNYQARNTLRDDFKLGDFVLVHHSSAEPPAIAGVAEVVKEGYPDHTAWDPNDHHYDPKSSPDNPRWIMVDLKLVEIFAAPVAMETLRATPALAGMELLKRGSRLSVQPVTKKEFETILKLAKAKTKA